MIEFISNLLIPFIVFIIILYGVFKKVDVYDSFLNGAKDSFPMILSMFPCLLAMLLGVNIFVKSNVLGIFLQVLDPFLQWIKVPVEVFYMMLMRPISGSSTLALLNSIYESFGPDGFIGTLASVIQGSTDTTFYVLTLYFGSIGIKKIRYALWAGLFADVVGIFASILIVNCFF